jgi:cell shape-determining protein MreC
VVEVGPNFSNVTLLTDGSSTVIGQLVSNAAPVRWSGDLAGALNMTKIDSAVPVQIGDEVVTAGIELAGGIRSPYPKGLLIARSSTCGGTPTTWCRPRSSSRPPAWTASNTCS